MSYIIETIKNTSYTQINSFKWRFELIARTKCARRVVLGPVLHNDMGIKHFKVIKQTSTCALMFKVWCMWWYVLLCRLSTIECVTTLTNALAEGIKIRKFVTVRSRNRFWEETPKYSVNFTHHVLDSKSGVPLNQVAKDCFFTNTINHKKPFPYRLYTFRTKWLTVSTLMFLIPFIRIISRIWNSKIECPNRCVYLFGRVGITFIYLHLAGRL